MIYILYGNDESRQELKLRRIIEAEKPDTISRFHADEADPSYPFNILDSVNLFGNREMVIIDRATFLSGKNQSLYQPADLAQRKDTDQVLVLMAAIPKLDTRKKAVKELMEKATVMECRKFDEKSLAAFIKEETEQRNLHFSKEAMDWFCSHAGKDALVLENTLDRLELYSDTLSLDDVKAMVPVSPEDNIFEMTNALFARQPLKLLGLYRAFRAQNMEPLAISGLLASQVRFIFQVRCLMDAGLKQDAIAKKLEASSGRIWNSMKNARRFSALELLGYLGRLSRLDEQLKSNAGNKDDVFESYILTMVKDQIG